jgi:hypothetical protein
VLLGDFGKIPTFDDNLVVILLGLRADHSPLKSSLNPSMIAPKTPKMILTTAIIHPAVSKRFPLSLDTIHTAVPKSVKYTAVRCFRRS